MKKIDWLIVLFLIIISVITLKDLYKSGFYTSHDGPHQVVRMYYFDQLVRDGQFPPRYVTGLFNGYGYPLFVFSYHMPWIIAEPLHLLGLSIIDSIKAVFLVGFFLSGVTMYLYQRELFGRFAAFTGAFLYLFAPYRFSNIFVRAAIGDATAFIFPPIIYLSLYKLLKKDKHRLLWVCLGAFSLGFLLLSHAMVFILFFIGIILYIFYNLLWIKDKLRYLLSSLSIVLLGIGISAYYLIPSITEKRLTVFSVIFKSAFSQDKFASLQKLIYSPWGYGAVIAKEGAMSLQLGIIQWLIVALSLLILTIFILKKKTSIFKTDYQVRLISFFLLLFIGSVIMMLPLSEFLWKWFDRLLTIDFTWRILAVSIFSVSILAGFVISRIKYKFLLALMVIFIAVYGNRNHTRINKSLDWSVPFFLSLEHTTNSFDEYTPVWVNKEYTKVKQEKARFSKPGVVINIIKNSSNRLVLDIDAPEQGRLRINTIYYPGWIAEINNRKTPIDYSDGGLMDFDVMKGKSRVNLSFQETPIRLISDCLSLLSIGVVILLLIKYRKIT